MAAVPAAKVARLSPVPTAAAFESGAQEFAGDSAQWSGLLMDRRWAGMKDAVDIDKYCDDVAGEGETEFIGRELSTGEAVGAAAGLAVLHEFITGSCHMRVARTDRGPPSTVQYTVFCILYCIVYTVHYTVPHITVYSILYSV